MSIFVCGDIHSTLDIHKLDEFMNRDDLNKNDYLIICGDTGICGFSKEDEIAGNQYRNGGRYGSERKTCYKERICNNNGEYTDSYADTRSDTYTGIYPDTDRGTDQKPAGGTSLQGRT